MLQVKASGSVCSNVSAPQSTYETDEASSSRTGEACCCFMSVFGNELSIRRKALQMAGWLNPASVIPLRGSRVSDAISLRAWTCPHGCLDAAMFL